MKIINNNESRTAVADQINLLIIKIPWLKQSIARNKLFFTQVLPFKMKFCMQSSDESTSANFGNG